MVQCVLSNSLKDQESVAHEKNSFISAEGVFYQWLRITILIILMVATDAQLSMKCRLLPFPLLYVSYNAINLEKPLGHKLGFANRRK
ncbi:hypothetical protein CEXT_565221 [Caerostris extrusa]|uniref:DUF202 domain-containing protein n=1 Tax=Caerostris extrusa TaxID=172846 RepID=A0AAV4RPH0_CAEEX|nr:hypothetical protein CEXT_565221 [Caerostris extrusa]